ncbi:SDR family oxidoreductase [Mycobacterium sp. AMU20-3851]|uniref:SDR family oxidoreductase n=1 Tax=Mycobacterium sp. AMU20-3851 TaxID=3122055 RepID=UPI0037548489
MTDWADVKVLAAAAAKLAGPGRRVETIVADVADPTSCERMAAEAQQRLGGLDVLCGPGPDAMAKMLVCIPQRRLGSPADIAAAAQFFAGEEAAFITGRHLVVDGGQTLPELPDVS